MNNRLSAGHHSLRCRAGATTRRENDTAAPGGGAVVAPARGIGR